MDIIYIEMSSPNMCVVDFAACLLNDFCHSHESVWASDICPNSVRILFCSFGNNAYTESSQEFVAE